MLLESLRLARCPLAAIRDTRRRRRARAGSRLRHPAADQPLEALLGLPAFAFAPLRRSPERIEARAHEPQLTAIRLEHALPGRRRLARHRFVHEPEHARRGHQRQEREQNEDPCAAFEPPVGFGA